jgi:hypothetical protein
MYKICVFIILQIAQKSKKKRFGVKKSDTEVLTQFQLPLKQDVLRRKYRVSQKWRTNGAQRYRRDYRKRQKNVKKIPFDLFADFAVFESGT